MQGLVMQRGRVGVGLIAVILLGVGCGRDGGTDAPAASRAPATPTSGSETSSIGKAIFVIEPSQAGAQAALSDTVRREITPRLVADPRVGRVVVSLPFDEEATDPAVASMIEVYGDAQALRSLARELDSSLGTEARLHAYLVSERLPRQHVQDWPDGTPTPGVRFVALMVRNPQLSRAEFDSIWRDEHTQIALAHTVEVLNYSQNTVVENLTEESASIDGIVGEQFASPSYSRDRMLKHPIQFVRGVASGWRFMDFGKTNSQLMVETVVDSGNGFQ
jgi:hypothetical protein